MTTIVRLGDVAHILRGTVPAHASEDARGHRFFGIAEVSAGGSIGRRLQPDTDLGANPVILLEGDVVVAQMGKPGDSVLIDEAASGSILGRECLAIRLKAGKQPVTPEWLAAYLRSKTVRAELEAGASGTAMPRVNTRQLAEIEVPAPTLDDQQRMLRRLRDLAVALADERRLLVSLERLYDAELELAVARTMKDAE